LKSIANIGLLSNADCREVYRYRFNGQEQDNEIAGTGNIMTAEFWMYDTRLGRRWNVDPKPDASVSSYACFRNNPIWLNDVLGDSAWKITNKWNDDYITKYNAFVGERGARYGSEGKQFTCEDFALTTAMDFAKENQLPFQFTNGEGTFDAASDKYTDFETFSNDVLKTSAAPDLQNDLNTTPVALDKVSAGTILLNRSSSNRATHVQMVISVKSNFGYKDGIKTFNILQGNSGNLNWIPGGGRIGGGDPTSTFYTGTTLERGVFMPQANYYMNFSTGKSYTNFSKERNIEFRQFDFKGMNSTSAGGSW